MRRLEPSIAIAVVALDQWTKALVRGRLELHESIDVISGWLSFTRVHNTGAAFGILNAADFPFKPLVLMLVAVAALSGVAWYAASLPAGHRIARAGLAAVLGGAIGNLIDRATAGYVLDFVDAYWRDWHFWAFNVADAAITVGAIFLLFDVVAEMLGYYRAPNPA
ncbi:MAG: signal peptidase II [Vicinamibacterales bacterium]